MLSLLAALGTRAWPCASVIVHHDGSHSTPWQQPAATHPMRPIAIASGTVSANASPVAPLGALLEEPVPDERRCDDRRDRQADVPGAAEHGGFLARAMVTTHRFAQARVRRTKVAFGCRSLRPAPGLAARGASDPTPIVGTDLYPTLLGLAGGSSSSMSPATLLGRRTAPRRAAADRPRVGQACGAADGPLTRVAVPVRFGLPVSRSKQPRWETHAHGGACFAFCRADDSMEASCRNLVVVRRWR